ncbi:uncharacterized protein PHA67_017646 [Liasis olivaceus]
MPVLPSSCRFSALGCGVPRHAAFRRGFSGSGGIGSLFAKPPRGTEFPCVNVDSPGLEQPLRVQLQDASLPAADPGRTHVCRVGLVGLFLLRHGLAVLQTCGFLYHSSPQQSPSLPHPRCWRSSLTCAPPPPPLWRACWVPEALQRGFNSPPSPSSSRFPVPRQEVGSERESVKGGQQESQQPWAARPASSAEAEEPWRGLPCMGGVGHGGQGCMSIDFVPSRNAPFFSCSLACTPRYCHTPPLNVPCPALLGGSLWLMPGSSSFPVRKAFLLAQILPASIPSGLSHVWTHRSLTQLSRWGKHTIVADQLRCFVHPAVQRAGGSTPCP